jgi:hypothetical protein
MSASRQRDDARSVSCRTTTSAFERSSKRRKGFPSELRVKKGDRVVHGTKDLIREAGPQRSMSLRLREVVSRTAVCGRASSMAPIVITMSVEYTGAPLAPHHVWTAVSSAHRGSNSILPQLNDSLRRTRF